MCVAETLHQHGSPLTNFECFFKYFTGTKNKHFMLQTLCQLVFC